MKDKIIDIMNTVKPGIDYLNEKDLIGNNILDSLEIVNLVFALSKAFAITINIKDIQPENFTNIETIERLVSRLTNSK